MASCLRGGGPPAGWPRPGAARWSDRIPSLPRPARQARLGPRLGTTAVDPSARPGYPRRPHRGARGRREGLAVTMISYAQNAEDVLLRRVFGGQARGFYLDVGANHPVRNSVTKHFYDRGWSGINCEPGSVFAALRRARPRDICLPVAVSNCEGARTFYEIPGEPGFSTLDPALARGYEAGGLAHRARTVPTRTLDSICAEYVTGPIDFLSVDTENHEREVLEGADWQRFRPRVVLVEANR